MAQLVGLTWRDCKGRVRTLAPARSIRFYLGLAAFLAVLLAVLVPLRLWSMGYVFYGHTAYFWKNLLNVLLWQ